MRLESGCEALRRHTVRAGQKSGEGRNGGGCSPLKQPQDWSVTGICVCIVPNGRAESGRGPAPLEPAATARCTKPEVQSAPWNLGQVMAVAAAPPSRSANRRACCRSSGPAPRRAGLGRPDWCSSRDRRQAVRAGGVGGPPEDADPAGRACKEWNFGESSRKDEAECKGRPKQPLHHLGRSRAGRVPGRRSGHRVAGPGMAEGRPGPRIHSLGAQRGGAALQGHTAKSPKLEARGEWHSSLGPYPQDLHPSLTQKTKDHTHKLHF